MNQEVFAAVAEALERGEPAALVTIVSTTGSTPQRVGAKMLVFGDGRLVGTIGGGCYENDAFGKAREAILNRRPQLVHYELDDDFAQETGLICGGQMSVYIEPIEPSPELYVDRRGTCRVFARESRARSRLPRARRGRSREVREPRTVSERRRSRDRRHSGMAGTNASPAARVRRRRHARTHERSRRGARARPARSAVPRPHRQPRQGRADLRAAARAKARARTRSAHIHAPIGLDIGAVTPQEIAVSILAELIAVKHGKVKSRDAAELSMKWTPTKVLKQVVCQPPCPSYPQRPHRHDERSLRHRRRRRVDSGRPDRGDRIQSRPASIDQTIDARGGFVLPGLIQTHIHLCQTLFRGYADDRPLMDWLRQRVWPMEAAHTPSTLRAAARLATTELLTTGTTAVLTMETVHDTDAVFEAVEESGLRATIGKCMMDSSREAPRPAAGADASVDRRKPGASQALARRRERTHCARRSRRGSRSPVRASCSKRSPACRPISRRWCTRMRRNRARRLRSSANSRAG